MSHAQLDWSDEMIARLTREWNADRPVVEIAAALGVSASTVSTKAHAIGLGKRRGKERNGNGVVMTFGRAGALLDTLPPKACRWPIGDVRDPDFAWCGHDRMTGRAYCAEHCARAYTTAKKGVAA